MRDCPLEVDKVQVEVLSAGPGFTVRLMAPDQKSGEEVLRRAQSLARQITQLTSESPESSGSGLPRARGDTPVRLRDFRK